MNKNELKIAAPETSEFAEILTPEALTFVGELVARFRGRVTELIELRDERQRQIDAGKLPDFLAETAEVRSGDWQVSGIPADLLDRRVEITGPTDRKMIINALNSGANVFMADCEDSLSPTWDNVIRGQLNLRDAVAGTIALQQGDRRYALGDHPATLIVRPRGWHLVEKHLLLDGDPVPAALVDFGLFLLHNASPLREAGTGPYFYLPKLESHREARLWAEVFAYCETAGIVRPGEIKVTVLIETLLAAFEIDEILYELREYIVGMNCGRWDYIFSYIKKFSNFPTRVLPDRGDVTMTSHFLRAYSLLVIKTCHRRGALAIGGMAAQIPIKNDAEANAAALAKVRQDKEREAGDGHDGTWVAHPALVQIARDVFDKHIGGRNQLHRLREDVEVTAEDLLQIDKGRITERGVRENISVAVQYMAAWLDGNGCVPINHLMEDAATAEISRAQLWQWVHHPTGILDEGRNVTYELFKELLREEMDEIRQTLGAAQFEAGQFRRAANLLDELTVSATFTDFLTSAAYADLD